MKLEEVYIKIGSKTEAEAIKNTLELLGEKYMKAIFIMVTKKNLAYIGLVHGGVPMDMMAVIQKFQ